MFITSKELYEVAKLIETFNSIELKEIGFSDVDVFDTNGERIGTVGYENGSYVFKA